MLLRIAVKGDLFLKKFDKNIHLIKGNSNLLLKKIDMSKIDYVFLDGGSTHKPKISEYY